MLAKFPKNLEQFLAPSLKNSNSPLSSCLQDLEKRSMDGVQTPHWPKRDGGISNHLQSSVITMSAAQHREELVCMYIRVSMLILSSCGSYYYLYVYTSDIGVHITVIQSFLSHDIISIIHLSLLAISQVPTERCSQRLLAMPKKAFIPIDGNVMQSLDFLFSSSQYALGRSYQFPYIELFLKRF